MPFWSNSDKENNYRAKLERKLCLAKETPEPVFDLSDCKLSEVPSGVFSMCRVFLKEALLLQNNLLHSLSNGGSLRDLNQLKVLNLSNNRFHSLAEGIGELCCLEVLNLENNQLKHLPLSFTNLKKLRSLNLKGNKLKEFPLVLCSLSCLQTLNVCKNEKIKVLPKEVINLLHLKTLELDGDNFIYPSSDICQEGTEAIKAFLCSESGKEYIPAKDLSDCADTNKPETATTCSWEDDSLSATYQAYQRTKDQRRQELLQMEKFMKGTDELHAQFTVDASLRKQKLLKDVAEEQERFEEEILQVQNRKEREKRALLAALSDIENHSAKLLDQLMCLNEQNKNFENILQRMEQDRIEIEEMFSIKQEELEDFRKLDVLNAMKDMLQNEEKQREREAGKLEIVQILQNSTNEQDQKLLDVLCGRDLDHQILINKLLEEELYQKEAFEVLQVQRDRRHQEIVYQIKLIEKELSKLTLAELKKQDLKANFEMNVLAEHRTVLAQLLADLLETKQSREEELKKRLVEIEQKHLDEMKDFWLIQYQKLMDKQPQQLLDAELTLDPVVRSVFIDAGAISFLPIIAFKNITWPQLSAMTRKDLKKIGILNESICEAILSKVKEYLLSPVFQVDEDNLEKRKKSVPEVIPVISDFPSPSAPPEELASPETLPSAPILSPESEMKLWCQIECVVCLDKESTAVFLPCGHVCCCLNCSTGLNSCPMCRNVISSKFVLTVS